MGDNMKDEEIEILDVEETKDDNIPDDIVIPKVSATDILSPNTEEQKREIKKDNLLDEQSINSDYNIDSKMSNSTNKKTVCF